MSGCPCPGTVPCISLSLAHYLLGKIPAERRPAILQAALEWLTARHEGLTMYVGTISRPYTYQERAAIELDTAAVASLPCPFSQVDGCLLGGLGPLYNRVSETGRAPYIWLPMAVARSWARDDVRDLIRRGYVADAKVALLTRNEGFLSRTTDGLITVS